MKEEKLKEFVEKYKLITNSIGRRSSILISPNKLENHRLSQEWNNRNIIEINKIYSDKTKLDINNSSIQSKKRN